MTFLFYSRLPWKWQSYTVRGAFPIYVNGGRLRNHVAFGIGMHELEKKWKIGMRIMTPNFYLHNTGNSKFHSYLCTTTLPSSTWSTLVSKFYNMLVSNIGSMQTKQSIMRLALAKKLTIWLHQGLSMEERKLSWEKNLQIMTDCSCK